MALYYFLATLLPDLRLGETPDLPFLELSELCQVNLKPHDLEKTRTICRLVDLENLRALWSRQPLDPHGNLGVAEIEDLALAQVDDLPSYLIDFLDRYSSLEDRLRYFAELIARFFQVELAKSDGFLHRYLDFERRLRLVLLGFRALSQGRNLSEELQFEEPTDELVMQILAQKDSRSYEPPDGFEELKPLFERYRHSPLELHKALIEYRLKAIEEMCVGELFSIDRILAYLVSVILVEQWNALDKSAGLKIIDSIVKDIS